MPTRFEELLRDRVEPHVDRIYAEDFILTPWKSTPNGRGGPDLGRTVVMAKGVLNDPAKSVGVQMGVRKTYREANDLRSLTTGREPYLSVDRSHFAGVANEPRQGDRISFPDRQDIPGYEVVSVERDGLTRLKMKLVQQGGQA